MPPSVSFFFFFSFFEQNAPVNDVRKSVVLYESWMDSFEGGKIKSCDKNCGVEVFVFAL